MTELKPCPFYGKKEADIFERPEPLFRGMFYPECRWCGAKLPTMHSRKEVIDTWNSRVESEAKKLTVEELKQMNGLPVWVEYWGNKTYKGWFICGEYEWRPGHVTDWITINGLQAFSLEDYGLEFICYDREPKED